MGNFLRRGNPGWIIGSLREPADSLSTHSAKRGGFNAHIITAVRLDLDHYSEKGQQLFFLAGAGMVVDSGHCFRAGPDSSY